MVAATTAHKVSTWENKCGEINTSSDILSLLRTKAVHRPGEVLWGSA